MGTITIEQYGAVGSAANRDAPIPELKTLLVTTKDTSTSTSAENITLNGGTKAVSIYAVEAHRVCLTTDTSATLYATIPAGTFRDFGVPQGAVLYYELDA